MHLRYVLIVINKKKQFRLRIWGNGPIFKIFTSSSEYPGPGRIFRIHFRISNTGVCSKYPSSSIVSVIEVFHHICIDNVQYLYVTGKFTFILFSAPMYECVLKTVFFEEKY
jgi:hypothetical protein